MCLKDVKYIVFILVLFSNAVSAASLWEVEVTISCAESDLLLPVTLTLGTDYAASDGKDSLDASAPPPPPGPPFQYAFFYIETSTKLFKDIRPVANDTINWFGIVWNTEVDTFFITWDSGMLPDSYDWIFNNTVNMSTVDSVMIVGLWNPVHLQSEIFFSIRVERRIKDAESPIMKPLMESQGTCYSSSPCFINFGFDDNRGLNDGWYKLDSAEWTSLFSDYSEKSWDNNGWCIPTSCFVSLAEGSHFIYFKALDDDGNEGGEAGGWRWQFYKDTTPPSVPSVITSSSHTPGIWSNVNTVHIEWIDAIDSPEECVVEGYAVVWDNSESTTPSGSIDIFKGEGRCTSPELEERADHYVHVRSQDVAGNWANTVHFGPFYIDITPPSAIVEAEDTVRSIAAPCFYLSGKDNVTSEEELLFSYLRVGKDSDFSDFVYIDSVCWDDLSQGGPYTLRVRARDVAGNVGPSSECTFYYDTDHRDGGMKGDVNEDDRITVIDILYLINCLIFEYEKDGQLHVDCYPDGAGDSDDIYCPADPCPPDDEMRWRADCNGPSGDCGGDGKWNILDVMKIQAFILGGDACP